MATDIAGINGPLGANLITITSLTHAALDDIMSGSTTVNLIEVDNTLNAGEACYVKLLNGNGSGAASAIVVGTDAPHHIFHLPQGVKRSFLLPEGMAFTKLNAWCVKEPGTAGTTPPTNAVKVEILVS